MTAKRTNPQDVHGGDRGSFCRYEGRRSADAGYSGMQYFGATTQSCYLGHKARTIFGRLNIPGADKSNLLKILDGSFALDIVPHG